MKNKPNWLIILLAVFVGLVGILGLVNLLTPSYSYDDPDLVQVENWLTHSTLVPREGYALLYHYSETCSFCEQIKDEILGFAIENDNDIPVVLADVNNPNLRASNNFAPQSISGTPTVWVFFNGAIIDSKVGPTPILDLMTDLDNGTYTP